MNTENKSYSIYGTVYECCFYNNGYDEGVRVFNNANDLLFEFDEKINAFISGQSSNISAAFGILISFIHYRWK